MKNGELSGLGRGRRGNGDGGRGWGGGVRWGESCGSFMNNKCVFCLGYVFVRLVTSLLFYYFIYQTIH